MTDLSDFEDGTGPTHDARPKIYLTTSAEVVRAPGGKIAGYVDRDRERGKAFLTRRHSEKHRFHKFDGYAVSLSVIAQAQAHDAEWIIVWVYDEKKTYVFTVDQYLDGEEVPDEYTPEHDRQKVVPEGERQEFWTDQHDPLIDIRTTGSGWGKHDE